MPAGDHILAIDNGTQSVRALLFDLSGELKAKARVEIEPYQDKRDRLLEALDKAGFEVVRPEGAFYLFPRVPGGGDDIDFVRACAAQRLLVVPGSGFARAGYFRMAFAVTDRAVDLAVKALGPVARAWAAAT